MFLRVAPFGRRMREERDGRVEEEGERRLQAQEPAAG